MERSKKEKRNRKKAPRVPIETYKWEDVRRARLKGGYPWTHLYKEPFNDEVDPKFYTMESIPESKSFSSPRKSSDQLEIKEVTNGSSEEHDSRRGSLTPEPSGYIVITEVPSDSESHSKDAQRGSLTIEDVGEAEAINLESAEDSDNISQYLDKEEPPVESATTSTKPTKDEEVKTENGRQERAKSEEPKRKRKLSIDSSYSRKSLSKLAIIKKLKEAKDKIKVRKLNLPSLPNLSVLSNPLKQDTETKPKKEAEKKEAKSKATTTQPGPKAKPVYIHIPLKPPEGQTDEFSYLEFGEKKPEEPKKEEEVKKQLEETPTIEISENFDNQRRYSENPDDIVAFEIVKTETIDLENAAKNGLEGGNDYLIIEHEDDNKSESRSMIIIMPNDEPSLSRTPSQRNTPSRQGSKRERAKSAEPERKRKLSADSGCSRNSLSKLGFLQKLKDAKDKIKLPKFSLSRSNSKKTPRKKVKEEEATPKESTVEEKKSKTEEQKSKVEEKKSKTEEKKSKTEEKKSDSKGSEPKYIHIPLKPPPGETDEFSHLEFEEKKIEAKVETETKTDATEVQEQSSVESPGSPNSDGVHFIFLTPPSDDEVLEQPDIPETPSSEKQSFFSGRMHELKQIAKDAVDSASPKSRRKLQSVTEEEGSDTSLPNAETEDTKKIESDEDKLKTSTTENKDEKLPVESEKVEAEKEVFPTKTKEETPAIETKDETLTAESKEKIKTPEIKKETATTETKKEKSKTKIKKEKRKSDPKTDKPEKEKGKKSEDVKIKQTEDIKIKKGEDSKETKPESEDKKPEKMVVDEEDGLKLTESAMAKQEQNIKAKEVVEPSEELKSNEKTDGSPAMKKKVSFKRRSKDETKDGDYEDIQAPTDDKSAQKNTTDEYKSKLAVMGNSQSMSVDEEKSYLDEQKIIKSTSLEEDYNRWSKLSDHEYEPVNPPPDNVSPMISLVGAAPPTVHVIDTDHELLEKPPSLASSTTSLERRMLGAETEASPEETFTAQELQTEIESKYFSKTAETPTQPQTAVHTTVTITETKSQPKKSEGPGRFQKAIKAQTDKFRTKLHEIKKPNIKLPSKPTIKKPNLQKFKFEKPKINLPKLPDTTKISLPTFSLPRKNPTKRSLKQRQLSTESNAGGSKKNYFDFRTYPRFFKKKPKDDFDSFSSKSEREVPEFATVPRTKRNKEDDKWGGRDSIRISLHAEEPVEDEEREDSVERRMASHMRYEQDIDIDDAYEKENQEIHAASPFSHGYNSRWNHGSFHPQSDQEFTEDTTNRQVTDLDSPGDGPAPHESFDTNTSKDIHSSESSLGIHRRGVLEEIDSDEFFLRQKGISQDNIEVGMYLSNEIREAFKYPTNALADLQRERPDISYDARASNQSLPETPSRRKAAKKPKRKKTPHVSKEQISFDRDSELDLEIPPSRPKRRSKRNKKQKDLESIIPYQETIAVDVPDITIAILQHGDDHEHLMYENEHMQGIEQPEIKLTDPYVEYKEKYDSEEEIFKEEYKEQIQPSAPPRKHRSLKSLSYSEHDSILGDVDPDREHLPDDVEVYKTEHEYIIPTPEIPPVKPPRTLSRSSSKSQENEEIRNEIEIEETPTRPTRTRSRSGTQSQGDSLTLDEPEEPCVEEPCVQDFRDSMGYAVIDKNVKREPPLPPPRTPPRRKKVVQSSEQRFFTVPRPLSDEPPTRPIRNYSTLGPSRPPRRKQPINMTDEEKENIDIEQYIEIEDEPNRDLKSGEVIQKMRDRPLPAPPRPPRKTRTLQDITSQENILTKSQEDLADEEKDEFLEETEVSTQTEPLPDDFLCGEAVHEDSEMTAAPRQALVGEESEPVIIERRLITPTQYSFEETITHGSLIVEPLNGARILPDSELTRSEKSAERIVPVTRDYDDETSEIPEEFTKLRDPQPAEANPPPPPVTERPSQQLKDPRGHQPVQTGSPSIVERIIERPVLIQPDSNSEIEVLRAQKLQVSDLDVDRLSVNELLASRIIVSEIESGSIQANEINSKSGALKFGELELPPALVQQLLEKLHSAAQEQSSGPTEPAAETSKKDTSDDTGQKKNSV